ncbi:MAG: hypothetical protein FWE35_16825 [Streptosporangiales bacterium]|nr:hypothetical protein [Streptosporangiales bacterium]
MRGRCPIWLTLATLAAAIAAAFGIVRAAQAKAAETPSIVITSGTVGSDQPAVFDLAGLEPGQHRTFKVTIRNDTGGEVTVRLAQVAFPGDGTGVLARDATVSLTAGNTVLGSGGPASSRLIGASTLIPAGTGRELTAEISLPASARSPGARGHSLTAEFQFSSEAGTAPVGTGISAGSGPGLPPTAESLAVFHAMVWASLAAFAAALVLGVLLVLRRRAGGDVEAGGYGEAGPPEGTRG